RRQLHPRADPGRPAADLRPLLAQGRRALRRAPRRPGLKPGLRPLRPAGIHPRGPPARRPLRDHFTKGAFMNLTSRLSLTGLAGPLLLAGSLLAAPAPGGYHMIKEIPIGGEGGWDYLT